MKSDQPRKTLETFAEAIVRLGLDFSKFESEEYWEKYFEEEDKAGRLRKIEKISGEGEIFEKRE